MAQATANLTCQPPQVRHLQRLRRAPEFYQENRNLLGSRDAFRKRLERRDLNGLAASGAVLETALGLMIDPTRFRQWLFTPNGVSDDEAAA
jgi:hypothetical protein